MSPSKLLFFICLSFIAGIFLESVIKIPQFFLWAFLFISFAIIVISLLIKKDILIIAGFCLLFLAIGILRVQISEFNIANDKSSKFNGKGKISIIGIIFNEPDVRDSSQKIKVKFNDSTVLVTTNKYPEYNYLDKIKITGKLEAPMVNEDFNYKNYLMKDGIYSVMDFPKVEIISQEHQYNVFSFLYENILFIKKELRKSIQVNFSPPQSSILQGTILGENGAMTNDLKDKLNITGLRHIIAVSGTHVVILSSLIMSLLLAVGFYRGKAFYIAIIFICVYIILTGLPLSGIRAGIMGGVYLLSQKLGRQTMGPRLLALACSLMLLMNPLSLFYDVGFQLSFLAVVGLIYLEPIFKNFIKKIIKDKLENLIGIVSTTFAAQVFTLPIMIYNFGNISFVSPITNLLILPVVYWLMVFGFFASIVGVFSNFLGFIFSIPCYFLTAYFLKVVKIFSQPWMAKTITNVSWIWVLIFYAVIGIATYFLNKKFSQKIV